MRLDRYILALALIPTACAGDAADREEAEDICARFEGTVAEPGCTLSQFEACVQCEMSCEDGCVTTLRLTTCSADENWGCRIED